MYIFYLFTNLLKWILISIWRYFVSIVSTSYRNRKRDIEASPLYSSTGYTLFLFQINNLVKLVLVGRVVQLAERRSLAGELTMSCTRSAADG